MFTALLLLIHVATFAFPVVTLASMSLMVIAVKARNPLTLKYDFDVALAFNILSDDVPTVNTIAVNIFTPLPTAWMVDAHGSCISNILLTSLLIAMSISSGIGLCAVVCVFARDSTDVIMQRMSKVQTVLIASASVTSAFALACAVLAFLSRACTEKSLNSKFQAEFLRANYDFSAVTTSWPLFLLLFTCSLSIVSVVMNAHWMHFEQWGPDLEIEAWHLRQDILARDLEALEAAGGDKLREETSLSAALSPAQKSKLAELKRYGVVRVV